MIGRLLHLGTGGTASTPSQPQATISRPVSSLESALFQNRNDQVFPLSAAPLTPSASGTSTAFDSNDDVDLDIRDVRVLIMQDTLGHSNASLLFDSQPSPASSTTLERSHANGQDSRRTPAQSRKGSITQLPRPFATQAESPQTRQGAFDRRGSLHARTQSSVETETQRASREYRDELATFSSCIFGNSELMAYKGTSTKVHVVPVESRVTDHPASIISDGRSSIGRSSTRTSKLSQSFTSRTVSPTTFASNNSGHRIVEKKKVLITRLFPVSLTNEDLNSASTPQNRFSDDNAGYPFPTTAEEVGAKNATAPRQRRTPMYAVVLVVQLPSSRVSTLATPKSAFRESGSYTEPDVFSSSCSSARPMWFNMTGSGVHGEMTDSSFSVDVEDRIDSLTQHWDIVIRTLTHLQSITATTIRTLLKQADVASPDPYATPVPPSVAPPRNQAAPDRRSMDLPRPKPPKSTVKLVSLSPNCLALDMNIAAEVNVARRRIVTGLKAARVVTGQGRWGIWRDEAIWTWKWTQSIGQGPFLYNLFTGFLGTHTDWLQALSPPSIRRRYLSNRQTRESEDLSLPARTIIVADDKMAARRLLFLLSAFLPANQQVPTNRAHRPSTSTSISGFAHSPPTYVVPVLREESLRRKINRRTGNRRTSHSRNTSQGARASAVPPQLAHLSMERNHERRVSDAGSIRPASIAMPGNDLLSRKSSAATTATILPETTTPHFSSLQRGDSNRRPRPESSGSLATDDLKRSLKRGESSSHVSTASTDSRSQSSRWGSVISGLWSPRRRESTSMSSPGHSSDTRSPAKAAAMKRDRLSEMVREASVMVQTSTGMDARVETTEARDVTTPRDHTGRPRPSFSQTDRTPDPTGAFESPVKTSINEDDGVIDVDFPFPDYITSFESAISSPSSSGCLSTPGLAVGLDSFENSVRMSADGDQPLNAAGWLTRFHPDFALQAIPPQDDLVDQVKATLRSEPTPGSSVHISGEGRLQQWVDVGRVIIADTTTNTVRRIVHRRLVKPRQPVERPGGAGGQSTTVPHTPSILPYETQLEEEFIEETVSKPDNLLVEAMEKVIGFQPDDSKDSPLSRSMSRVGSDSGNPLSETLPETSHLPTTSLDVPRMRCKTIILSALEDLIRDVSDRREKRINKLGGEVGGRYQESLLQEAIREWISNLDTGVEAA
ncbi:hypothetical protein ACO1O0_002987 [Amphichorda felina]